MCSMHSNDIPADCIIIYTDGSCIGNPGRGGWAVSLERHEQGECTKTDVLKGSAASTTNNRMELQAALSGLSKLSKDEAALIIIRSDSRYVIDGMTKWRQGWEKRGWRKTDGTPVANENLWRKLVAAERGRKVRWEWVRGHAGDLRNDKVDQIARQQARGAER